MTESAWQPQAVNAREAVTRFAVDEAHEFSRSTGKVKSGAFRVGPAGRFSVFRISAESLDLLLPDDAIWALARDYVEPSRGPVLARVDLLASDILAAGLGVDADGRPHPRHANVIGWPEKEKQLEIRQTLAKAARLVLRN